MSWTLVLDAPTRWLPGGLCIFPSALEAYGHAVLRVPNVGGGMNAIAFHADGSMEGAACWRADGTPIGVSGGMAREGVRFLPETRKP